MYLKKNKKLKMLYLSMDCIGQGGTIFKSLENGYSTQGIESKNINKMVEEINNPK